MCEAGQVSGARRENVMGNGVLLTALEWLEDWALARFPELSR